MLLSRNFEISTNNRKGLYSQPSRRNSSCPARTVPLVCHARFAVERAARKRLGHPYEKFTPHRESVANRLFPRPLAPALYARSVYLRLYSPALSAEFVLSRSHRPFSLSRTICRGEGCSQAARSPAREFQPHRERVANRLFPRPLAPALYARSGHEKRHLTVSFVVGLNRLELSTSRLSGACSNQLSYNPEYYSLAGVVEMHGFEPRTS